MKLEFKKKDGIAIITASSLNDLFHISKVIEAGDLVSARTTRKIKVGGEDTRSRAVKKTAYIQIAVTKASLDYSSATLKVQGKVKTGPDDVPLDSAHSLSIEIGTEVTIIKEWKEHQLERLRHAEKQAAEAKVLVVCLDDEEASFASLSDSGVHTLGAVELALARKAEGVKVENNQLLRVAEFLNGLFDDIKPQVVVVASPGFWKNDLYKILKDKFAKLSSKVKLETINSGGGAGINELLSKGVLESVASESRLQQEHSLIEDVVVKIAKKGLVEYGFNLVKKAVASGAVDRLLISERFLEKFRSENRYAEVDDLINSAEKQQGRVFIIDSDHDAGKKLDGLGGVAALLRFRTSPS